MQQGKGRDGSLWAEKEKAKLSLFGGLSDFLHRKYQTITKNLPDLKKKKKSLAGHRRMSK